MTKRFLTVPETAEHLCVSERLVYDRIAAGDLPSARIGGRRLVPVQAPDEWVNAKVEQSRAKAR